MSNSVIMGHHQFLVLPIIAGSAWYIILVMLMAYWEATGRPVYSSMEAGQSIAYISDIGADRLKPLFIICAAITTFCFNGSLLVETWIRYWRDLKTNFTQKERRLSIASIGFGLFGGFGLFYLSIFDTKAYPKVHNFCLFSFMGGFLASAVCNCLEYQSMAARNQDSRNLKLAFRIKFVFIVLEVGLALGFVTSWRTRYYNAAAVLEWILASIFGFHLFSYAIDLFQARYSSTQSLQTKLEIV